MKFKSDIQAESKVGIGTDTVNYPLDVRAGSANSDIAQFTGANDSRGLKISTFQLAAPDDSVDYDCQYNGNAPIPPFGVQTWSMSGNEKVRLDANGFLGIGTTSISDPLVVRNGTSDTSVKILSFNNTTGTEATLKFSTFANNNNHVKAAIIARNAAGSFGRSDMHFALDSVADTGNVQFSDTKMTILNGGNVGIGTTSPGSKLQVDGEIDANGNDGYRINGKPWANESANILKLGDWDGEAFSTSIYGSNSSEVMRVTGDSVGIGTTSPDTQLEVSSSAAAVLRLTSTDTTVTQFDSVGRLEFKANDTSTGGNNVVGFVDCISNDRGSFGTALLFGTTKGAAATEKMRINPTGNVGIGTTSPIFKLDLGINAVNLNTATNKQIVLNVNGGYTGQTTDQYKVIGYTGSIASNTDIFTQTSGENLKNFYTGVFGGAFFNSSKWGLVQGGSTRFCVLGGTAANGAGNVGINDTTPSYKLDVNGEGRFTGDLRCLSLIQTSQSDKKEFISDIVKTTNKKIEFKEYVYKSDSGNRKRYGVLAEDIEVDYPELVHVDADGVKGVNYIDLLVKRVAELEKELEDISLIEGPKGDTGNRGLRGYTGPTGSQGIQGADGKDGNSHLSDVSSIMFNEKSGQLEIRIGRETYRFNQDK